MLMKTYLLNLWDSLRSSYWFVPSLCALGAILLSVLLPLLDAAVARAGWSLPEWVQTTTPAARATLSVMAGSMVAVTGTVFSITIVTLSLASQQFGPRLLRRFMYDLVTQVTLGVFLSTGIYCLLILQSCRDPRGWHRHPALFRPPGGAAFRPQHGHIDPVHSPRGHDDPGAARGRGGRARS